MVTIRPATAADAFALVDILVERHPDTRYAGLVEIDQPVARKLFAQSAFRHGHTNEGGCYLMVAERAGKIEAFMLGVLARIYGVGDKLNAVDVYLLGRRDCSPRALNALVDGYIRWAENNPKVAEIVLSWSDTIPGTEGVTALFERKGFAQASKTYRRTCQHDTTELAA